MSIFGYSIRKWTKTEGKGRGHPLDVGVLPFQCTEQRVPRSFGVFGGHGKEVAKFILNSVRNPLKVSEDQDLLLHGKLLKEQRIPGTTVYDMSQNQ